jgi:hypothetical protein
MQIRSEGYGKRGSLLFALHRSGSSGGAQDSGAACVRGSRRCPVEELHQLLAAEV